MNEITEQPKQELSSDINIITAEINAYKQVAGEAIFEIGRRLKHVKENDLAHGEFGKWLESVDINARVAQKLVKVADELGGNTTTYSHLGLNALDLIATLPPEERTTTHTTPKGEQKTPSEMTVRELRQLKADLKRAEERAEVECRERERLEELASKEPTSAMLYVRVFNRFNEKQQRVDGLSFRVLDVLTSFTDEELGDSNVATLQQTGTLTSTFGYLTDLSPGHS